MSDLFTAYPHLLNTLHMALTGLLTAGVIALAYTTSRKFSREIASKITVSKLKAELSQIAGMQADLEDRFTRFQKREGMRAVRAAKTSEADLKADAQALLASAQGGPAPAGTHPKAELYKRARGH